MMRIRPSVFILAMSLASFAVAAPDEVPLTLERALEMAAASHPELEVAAALTDAADAEARQQGAWPNPQAYFILEGAPRDGDAWGDANRVVGLEQHLPLWGRRGAERDAARGFARSVAAQRRGTALGVAAAVRAAHARGLFARDVARLRDDVVDAAQRALEVVEKQRELGEAADADVAHVRYELGVAELASVRARADLVAARAELAAAIGVDADAVTEPAGVLGATIEVPDLDALLKTTGSAPAVQGATARAEAADAAARAASRARLPELGVSFGLRRFGGGGDGFDAGLRFALPLFDRGGARHEAAKANAAAGEAGVRSAHLELERRIRAVHARLSAAETVVKTLDRKLLPAADTVLATAERRYALGEAELPELLQVRASWLERRLAALDARLELDLARAELSSLI